MSITIERRTVDAMTLVALRGIIPTYSDEHLLWERMLPEITRQQIKPTGPGGVIEHNDGYTAHDVDEEIFLPVAPGTVVEEPLVIHELPARDCLVARIVGPYDQIPRAYELLIERMAREGLSSPADGSPAANAFNLYLTTPGQVPADQLVTEACIPLAHEA